jgi:hypothetical protein
MFDREVPERLHVVLGAPWKEAAIRFVEPSASFASWAALADVRRGDEIVVVFDCEPRLVVTEVGRIEVDGGADSAIARMSEAYPTVAVPVSLIGGAVLSLKAPHTVLEGAAVTEVLGALDRYRFALDEIDRFGHTSMAVTAVLLDSRGRCDGCGEPLGVAPDAVEVRTVESLQFRAEPKRQAPGDDEFGRPPSIPVDWPAALCIRCQQAMRDNGFESFLDFRFVRHPACPRCGGRQTQRGFFGMPMFPFRLAPWEEMRGCCVTEDIWRCTLCMHRW